MNMPTELLLAEFPPVTTEEWEAAIHRDLKGDDYEFRTPFWYSKANPDQPLCPKCFASNIPAPMSEPGQGCNERYRYCLVCSISIEVSHLPQQARSAHNPRPPTAWS